MNLYLLCVGVGVVGAFLGMWIAKHPADTRSYLQIVWQKLSGLFKKKPTVNPTTPPPTQQ